MRPARVVVLGAGNVGWNAAWIAQGMEAEVLLLDKNLDRLRWVDQIHKGRIMTLASNRGAVERAVADADLVIGAVLVPGGRAPVVVTESMVRTMKRGAVIVDCAVDQGGCIETIHETTHADPVYELHGVLHYAVGNIPGAVPHTSTYALTNATLPYARRARDDRRGRRRPADPELAMGVNTRRRPRSRTRPSRPRSASPHRPARRRPRGLTAGCASSSSAAAPSASRSRRSRRTATFFESLTVADRDVERATRVVDRIGDVATSRHARSTRVTPTPWPHSPPTYGADAVMNACDPRLNRAIFDRRVRRAARPTSTWR